MWRRKKGLWVKARGREREKEREKERGREGGRGRGECVDSCMCSIWLLFIEAPSHIKASVNMLPNIMRASLAGPPYNYYVRQLTRLWILLGFCLPSPCFPYRMVCVCVLVHGLGMVDWTGVIMDSSFTDWMPASYVHWLDSIDSSHPIPFALTQYLLYTLCNKCILQWIYDCIWHIKGMFMHLRKKEFTYIRILYWYIISILNDFCYRILYIYGIFVYIRKRKDKYFRMGTFCVICVEFMNA